jgi:hypothetical protein
MTTLNLNETQVLGEVRLTKNKLENMKDHLETLLRKKIRIESEISVLRKAIKNKEKNFALKIKTGVQLESSSNLVITETAEGYSIGLPEGVNEELRQEFLELCAVSKDISDLLLDYQEDSEVGTS